METTSTQHPQPAVPDGQPQVILVSKPTNGLATAAMVLGIVAIVFSFIPVVNTISLVLAIVGIGLVIPAFIKARKTKAGMGKSVAAIVLAIASIFMFTVVNAAAVSVIDDAVNSATASADDLDVTFGARSTEYGITTVQVTIENISDDVESPWLTIQATSADGSEVLDTTSVIVNDLQPGQRTTQDAIFTESIPADAVLSVSSVL